MILYSKSKSRKWNYLNILLKLKSFPGLQTSLITKIPEHPENSIFRDVYKTKPGMKKQTTLELSVNKALREKSEIIVEVLMKIA